MVSGLAANASPQGLIPEQTALADGEIIGCAPLPPPQGNLLFHAYFRPETTDRKQEKSAGSGNAESTAEKVLS